ncbi:hypothetical protein SSX86_020466 [Deinandra increscens subsp. villosa]|uniref:DUF674 domain-containing protein n=1 Tax=Deinandra increscens subsp. villosa TaxID=3103831 RepID=A0AAP0CT37_9ASTR
MATTSSKITLKLLVDKKGQRVLFAEAGKDFVDFLFSLLEIPVGAVFRLLENSSKIQGAGMAKVYTGALNLSYECRQPNGNINGLFKHESLLPPLLSLPVPPSLITKFENIYGDWQSSSSAKRTGGFVKGTVSYMVMDDLAVSPMILSTISNLKLLRRFNINDLDMVEEKVVHMGRNEVINMNV